MVWNVADFIYTPGNMWFCRRWLVHLDTRRKLPIMFKKMIAQSSVNYYKSLISSKRLRISWDSFTEGLMENRGFFHWIIYLYTCKVLSIAMPSLICAVNFGLTILCSYLCHASTFLFFWDQLRQYGDLVLLCLKSS